MGHWRIRASTAVPTVPLPPEAGGVHRGPLSWRRDGIPLPGVTGGDDLSTLDDAVAQAMTKKPTPKPTVVVKPEDPMRPADPSHRAALVEGGVQAAVPPAVVAAKPVAVESAVAAYSQPQKPFRKSAPYVIKQMQHQMQHSHAMRRGGGAGGLCVLCVCFLGVGVTSHTLWCVVARRPTP